MNNTRQLSKCFIWTFILGIAAHGFCYFNTSFNHDSTMIYLGDDTWKASLGRYVDPIYRIFRTRYSAPWLTGILSLTFLALAAFLIVDMFHIHNSLFLSCVCAILATNYSLIFTNAFCIHDTDSYMFAILLSVFGAYALTSLKCNQYIRIILGSIALAGSMGIYQAYATLSFALILIYILLLCLNNEDFSKILYIAIHSVCMYALGAVIYIVGMKLYLTLTNTELFDAGHNSITKVFSLDNWNISTGIGSTYKVFYEYFFKSSSYNRLIMSPINIIIIFAILIISAICIVKKRIKPLYSFIILLILIVYPFVLSALCVLSTEIGHLMKFQFFTVYLLAILLIQYFVGNISDASVRINKALIVSICVLVFYITYNNIAFANGLYLSKVLEYQSTREIMTRVIDDIDSLEEYIPEQTEVLFVGSPYTSPYFNTPRSGYGQMGGSGIAGLELYTSVTGYYTYYDFIKEIMNEQLVIGSSEEASAIAFDPQVINMPTYPAKGSVQYINDRVIVKFSETPVP